MPLSPNEIRMFGYRSSTPAPITAARMLTRFIWNPAVLVKNAARRVMPVCFSRTPGGSDGNVWKCSGRFTSLTACHNGSHIGCHMDLRDSYLINSREHGQLRSRDIEVALGRLSPSAKNPAPPRTMPQLHAQIAAAFASDRSVPSALREAHERTTAIQALVNERVGGAQGVDLAPLLQPLGCLLEACDTALGARTAEGDGAQAAAEGGARAAGGPGDLRTRADAVQMLEMVCRFMEQHEPSNPAPLLIRRAQRLVQMNFLEIVKDLMPDSLSAIEKLAGEVEKS